MADGTKIEWTDATWNPITGCAVVSPGCTNCYAMKLAGTRLKHIPSRAGLTRDTKAGPVWTGEIRFNAEWLDQPLRWKRPRMIFVCAHGDLFAPGVTDEMLDQVFAVMALAPQHTFQVLTKRPMRMRDYCSRTDENGRHPAMVQAALLALTGRWNTPPLDLRAWPLANVWAGVSAEDQRRADERVAILLDTPAAVRWVSAEPLLGPIDFTMVSTGAMLGEHDICIDALHGPPDMESGERLDWIVVGGESGHGARPMHPDWARTIRDQCAVAGVPFHFKQHGAWAPLLSDDGGSWPTDEDGFCRLSIDGARTEDGWPMQRVGKTFAGRLLDGVQHDGYPQGGEVVF